ncbi:GIY-YIG nuclease family protein [Isoptericola halotolerans]
MVRTPGKQVRLFLVDGTPGGLMTAEIMNWTGHVLRGKHDKLGEIRRRPEAQRTCVYILLSDDPETTGGRRAYIGQSDDVASRLTQHDAHKEFWDEVVLVTSKDANLTSAHVRYLEARLVALAKVTGRAPLLNGNAPTGGAPLPEADASDMDYFIEQLRILLPVLGIDLFRGRDVSPSTTRSATPADMVATDAATSPVFHLRNRKHGVDARAQQVDGVFTVLTGSRIRASMPPRAGHGTSTARQCAARQERHAQLIADGSAHVEGTSRRSSATWSSARRPPQERWCRVPRRPTGARHGWRTTGRHSGDGRTGASDSGIRTFRKRVRLLH